jgi:malate dehydrogenase (oxaloacetate-decarboxylating)(NADP+)
VHVLQLGSTVRSIVNMTLIAVIDAQAKCETASPAKEAAKRKWWQRRPSQS